MKKSVLLTMTVLLLCLLLTSCGTHLPNYETFWREISPKDTIVWNEDDSITYNGTKYISIMNTNGKIKADYDSEHCVKIATVPYSFILGAVSVFYGDDFEDPDIISCSRGGDVWIKEGIDIDELIMSNTCVIDGQFTFRICDVITDECIPYSSDYQNSASLKSLFYSMSLENYPAFNFDISIKQIDGKLYLQYVWNSDFYKITEEFESDLRTNGFIN